jgi:pimeloyl-ACP methyl ester carboxylesterase
MKRAAAVLAVAVLTAGCHSGPQPPPQRQQHQRQHLSATHRCQPIHATCATLTVPLDHSGRTPGKLRLPVAMKGPSNAPRGVLVFLTGGPGQPGAQFLTEIDLKLGSALDGYRVVMFDQRGTGRDALRCPALQHAVGASDLTVPPLSALRSCAASIGAKRRFFTTADTVADLDELRVALGVTRWTLDGVSYGTFTAERYALAHPANVKALVLDSVVPQEGINPFQLETIHAVPRVLRSACAQRHCGSDPVADLAAVVKARHDGPALLDTLVTLSIADPDFRALPRALSEARAGKPRRLDRLVAAVHRGDAVPATFLSQGLHDSTLCEDFLQPWGGPSVPVAQRLATMRRAAAHLTPSGVYPFDIATATGNGELVTCENWPPVPVRASAPRQDLPNVPVLLLAGDRDLSTPLQWPQSELRHAPNGKLVVVHGAGHSVQLRARNPAGRRALVRFLQG